MMRLSLAAFAAAAVLSLVSAHAGTQVEPPVSAFAELPPSSPMMSPDGTRFAVIRGVNGRPSVLVYKFDAPSEPPQIVTSADWIIEHMRWVKNDTLLVYSKKNMKLGVYDRYRSELLRPLGDAAAVWLKDKKFVELTAYADLADVALDDPDNVYVLAQGSVFRMNVRDGGRPEPYIKKYLGPEQETGVKWFLDGHGKVLARVDAFHDPNFPDLPRWHETLRVPDGDGWRDLRTYEATVDEDDGVQGVSEDGKSIIRVAPDAKGTASLTSLDIATGKEIRLFQDPTYDVSKGIVDEWTGRVIGYEIDEDMPVYRYFDAKRQTLQEALEHAFPGLSVHIVSADLARDKLIVETVGPRTPESYYLFDRGSHRATPIAAGYPSLDENILGDVKPYPYAARDGLPIHAYLTLPPARPAHNLPLVVLPHGGPDARDDMRFDFMSQFLANRGYAVLRPNFRGSAGYGRPFTEAGLHQWGLKMQDDISDGVKKTVADGIVDPKRVCIFGASYGGYAALAGATVTPELYACIISFEGVADLPSMLGYEHHQFRMDLTDGSFWTTRMGDAFTDSALLDASSPAQHADRAIAPILLLHCELDVTVPISQSEAMDHALNEAHKRVEFVRIAGDDHYMSLEETRLRVLDEVEKFLGANIGHGADVAAIH